MGSRRVEVIGLTPNPDADWMAQQARNIAMVFQKQPNAPEYLLRDRNAKFTARFDAILKSEGVEVKPVGPLAPNMNAHAGRFAQSIKNVPPTGPKQIEDWRGEEVVCRGRLSGLLKSYRKAG